MNCSGGKVVVVDAEGNAGPVLGSAAEVDMGETVTAVESAVGYVGKSSGESDAYKGAAVGKRRHFNGLELTVFPKREGLKFATTVERIERKNGEGFGEGGGEKFKAIKKCRTVQGFQLAFGGKGNAGDFRHVEGLETDKGDAGGNGEVSCGSVSTPGSPRRAQGNPLWGLSPPG